MNGSAVFSSYLLMSIVVVIGVMISLNFTDSYAQQVDLEENTRDLVFESVDLEFRTEDIEGGVKDIGGEVTGLEMTETETEVKIELSGDILFDFDMWDIRSEAEQTLKNVAQVINQYQGTAVLVEGHTDSKGSDSYNQELSQKRADSIKDWLVEYGEVDKTRINTRGLGESKPVAANEKDDGSDAPEGRQKNRRVEITVKK